MSVGRLTATFAIERVNVDGAEVARLKDEIARNLTAPELAVHRALLWHLNDETGRCDPSHERLAAATGFSVATIKRALFGLRDKGVWTWRGKAGGTGRGRCSNSYELQLRLTNSSDGAVARDERQDRDLQLKSTPTYSSNQSDQKLNLSEEQEGERKENRESPNPSDRAGARDEGEGKGEQPQDLASRICSILQGGVDSLSENDHGRPWPRPSLDQIARVLNELRPNGQIALAAAREAREIVQAQDRAPSIAGLFESKLREACSAHEVEVPSRAPSQRAAERRDLEAELTTLRAQRSTTTHPDATERAIRDLEGQLDRLSAPAVLGVAA